MAEKRAVNCGLTDIGLSRLESCPCAAGDIGFEAPASDGPAAERVKVYDAANTITTVSNANLDVIVKVSVAHH